MNLLRPFAIVMLACAPSACGTQEERPPPAASQCTGRTCGSMNPPVGGGNGGSGGTGVPDAALVDSGVRIEGAVGALSNEDFVTSIDFMGDGIVGGEGELGRVSATFSDAAYVLPGVVEDAAVWMDLEATTTTLDVMSTLQRVDTRERAADLFFVQRGTLEDLGAALLTPVAPSADRGHAVVRFIDGSGAGVAGITITDHPGEVVAYDTGAGIFRDDETETSTAGVAIVLNATAVGFPGAVTRIAYQGTAQGTVDVKLASDAATLVSVVQ